MLNNIKAAIFDMDGTLVDSMWVWTKIDIDFLKMRNIECPENLKDEISHLSFEETAEYFKKTFNLKESIDEICNEWNNMAFEEYKNNVPLKPGVKKFLDMLKSMNIKIGLATSNCHLLLETALKTNGIYEYFDAITTTDEVSRGKQFPDVYLLTAKKLNVSPSECIVFEDILPAVMGAKAAGMKVVGIYDEYSHYQKNEILTAADKYIYEYYELMKDAI
ncbi:MULTISPECIES: HAD family hydrolase [Clostridium]|uniref:2-deoxyglucose-6-phosphate phosphatase n=2 Tax=Clostridium TaxID=1485 RepID=A0A151AMN0_9CLOT|nr:MULTISPECIES: HAD family phosphatase [Clostridium]KYH28657.1 2-deoxyglucose-6-phosphate phosphatase [Clostridium colicanis DSM 13634]MBE6045005.1 HAD family phosphatase [Clostridium thermopalmarium]PRR73363.1 2-deoxyglucose-6-phosphate phosphatase [Clostridium thermopalmarium DSM 5974]PVZ22151.1 HAD superfamily hydrolase (TIGR01509 family) [Clostridium thermopalmarium DSM 5974]